MIEIKCTQQEKEKIIDALAYHNTKCIFEIGTCECDNCRKCLDKRIEWTIRGE